MRVTKNIKEYITKKVEEKISVKYEVERLEAERQEKIRSEILEAAAEAAGKVYRDIVENATKNVDFLEFNEDNLPYFYNARCVTIKDRVYTNSVHNYRGRMNKEIKEKVDEIIVTLELGGNKEDLDKMLSAI